VDTEFLDLVVEPIYLTEFSPEVCDKNKNGELRTLDLLPDAIGPGLEDVANH